MKLDRRKVRRLMKHFQRLKTGRPKTYYEEKRDMVVEDIKDFKESFLPRLPKIIVDTKEKEILTKVKKSFDERFKTISKNVEGAFGSKFKETEEDLSQDEERLYSLFNDVNSLRENVEEQESELKEHEEDVMKKLDDIQSDIMNLESRKPLVINKVGSTVAMPHIEAPIMTKDKRVDKLQQSLMTMQETLNQLIDVKTEEDKMKHEEYEERLEAMDKAIKKFEMKLIRLQTKKNSKQLKPLINKIAQLKNKYNKMAVRVKSRTKIRVKPLKLGAIPVIPDEIPRVNKVRRRRGTLPSSLELPDISQDMGGVKFDLPEPVPQMSMPMHAKVETKPKKKGFFGWFK